MDRHIFSIEQGIMDLLVESVTIRRQAESAPIVEQLFSYLNTLWFDEMLDRTSLLGRAVDCSIQRESGLKAYPQHPDIPISNNHVERTIRPFAVCKMNWLSCWSEIGAKYSAIAKSLIDSCKIQGISPWDFRSDVPVPIDAHPATEIDQLIPKFRKSVFSKT